MPKRGPEEAIGKDADNKQDAKKEKIENTRNNSDGDSTPTATQTEATKSLALAMDPYAARAARREAQQAKQAQAPAPFLAPAPTPVQKKPPYFTSLVNAADMQLTFSGRLANRRKFHQIADTTLGNNDVSKPQNQLKK